MRSIPDKKGLPPPSAGRKSLVSLSDYLEASSHGSASEFRDLTQNIDGPNSQAEVDPEIAAQKTSTSVSRRDSPAALGMISRFWVGRLRLPAPSDVAVKSSTQEGARRLDKYKGD